MELKHWHVKFKIGEGENATDREMRIDGDAIQTEQQAESHVKLHFPDATEIKATEGRA